MVPIRLRSTLLEVTVAGCMLALLATAARGSENSEQSFVRVAKLTAADGAPGDKFGVSVSISGDTAVVGASAHIFGLGDNLGSAYVFERDDGGPNAWRQVAKLDASDGAARDEFGRSVAIRGDVVIVGASKHDIPDFGAGAAYIFERDAGGAGAWGQVAKLTAADAGSEDYFGAAVSLSADRAVVGAPGRWFLGRLGCAYIFERDGNGGAWKQVAKIVATDGLPDNQFGTAAAIEGNTVVVGAYEDNSAYVFERDAGGPGAWGQVAKLSAPRPFFFDDVFGDAVALSGSTIIVGNYTKEQDTGDNSGAAYVFERDAGGPGAWGLAVELAPLDPRINSYFGSSVTISGDTVVVGARGYGSAYVFERDTGGPDAWGQVAKLVAPDVAPDGQFGDSGSISGDSLVLGAPDDDDLGDESGSAHIFLGDPSLAIVGLCPGKSRLIASALTPLGRVELYGAFARGSYTLLSGPCAGTQLDLDQPTILSSARADGAGAKVGQREFPEQHCGAFLQLVDVSSCSTSNVVEVP